MYEYDYCIIDEYGDYSIYIDWVIQLRDQISKKEPGAKIYLYPIDGKLAY